MSAMNAVRFGSYSIRSTVAGSSRRARLKSTSRSARLWPPPRKRTVMRPLLLRAPVLLLPVVRPLTGLPFQMPERSTRTSWRRPGVTGLYVLSAMIVSRPASESGGDVDGVALGEGHDGLLHVAARTGAATEVFRLALGDQGIHALHLHIEELFDGVLDL